MLIDEQTISQAEFTGQFFRAAAGTVFVGSPTIGANGDITNFKLPGGITVTFTGQSEQWPDGKQLQRVGLVPDVLARPTKAGLAAGRDEVLEAALAYLDGALK
jgi:C-terminal processing protease CtpA/Prc